MEQPDRFGSFLLFQQCESNAYRTSYRAGIARGQAIDRIVRLEIFDGPAIDARRLLAELPAAQGVQAKLADPHIARGVDLGQVGGIPYAAYDFELGTTLSTFLEAARDKSFPVPFDQALFIAERIALALAAAHRAGTPGDAVSHSFLTPDSVLLTNEGEVKVLGFEFGSAVHAQLASDPDYASYLSPETRAGQARSAPDDVFSLGSILYELVTGSPLPPDPKLDNLVVQATGESASDGLRQLLETSLSPCSSRLPHVMAWQQTLGKLILDGEHNPTTFNLAFMMHTILRSELERDATSLKREKNYLLPEKPGAGQKTASSPGASGPAGETDSSSAAVSATLPAPEPEPTAPAPVTEAASSASVSSAASASSKWRAVLRPESGGRKPFWLGFAISALSAGIVLGMLWPFGDPASGQDEVQLRTSVSFDGAATRVAPQAGILEAPSSRTPEADQSEPAQVVRTEIVHHESEQAPTEATSDPVTEPTLDPEELEQLVKERALEIERELKAEYEKKLETLRTEIEETPPATAAINIEAQLAEAEPRAAAQANSTLDEPIKSPPGPRTAPADALSEATEATSSDSEQGRAPTTTQSELSAPPATANDPAPSASSSQTATAVLDDLASAPDAGTPTKVLVAGSEPLVALSPARLVRLGTATYPAAARKLGLTAKVRVKALVGTDGRVKQAEILGAEAGRGFDFAALAAVRKSRWEPATRGGEPVEAWKSLTIEFQP